MALKQTFGFLGAGRMATALAGGMVKASLIKSRQLVASDLVPAAAKAFAKTTGGKALKGNAEVVREANVIVIAVKPHQVLEMLSELSEKVTAKHLFISIASGVTLAQLENALGKKARVMRVMPNTPALVGAGAAGFARGQRATNADAKLAAQVLDAVGLAVEVETGIEKRRENTGNIGKTTQKRWSPWGNASGGGTGTGSGNGNGRESGAAGGSGNAKWAASRSEN